VSRMRLDGKIFKGKKTEEPKTSSIRGVDLLTSPRPDHLNRAMKSKIESLGQIKKEFPPRGDLELVIGQFLIANLSAPPPHVHNCRSSERYWIASDICSLVISSAPARSAIVRPTFRIRS
jgi:hypothetical protein